MIQRDSEPPRLAFLWISAFILLATAIGLDVREQRAHRNMALRDAEAQTNVLAGSVSAALAFDDKEAMRQYLGALLRNPQVAAAGAYGVDGRPLAVLSQPGAAPLPSVVEKEETTQSHGRSRDLTPGDATGPEARLRLSGDRA